jgi:hypothetical protein
MNLCKTIPLAIAALAVNALAASPAPMPREIRPSRATTNANQDSRLIIAPLFSPLMDLADSPGRGEYGEKLRRTMIAAPQFRPESTPAAELTYWGSGYYFLPAAASGDGWYRAPFDLPDGASLCYFGVYAYDSTTSHISAQVVSYSGGFQAIGGFKQTIPATPTHVLYMPDYAVTTGIGNEFAPARVGGSGSLGMPNCITINNDVLHGGSQYAIELSLDSLAADGTQMFRGVELAWYRTISPAPATASFTDVPTTDGFFQAIEAMKASGITTGCGGTSYCPNAAVTRGQMAAFLARALGL